MRPGARHPFIAPGANCRRMQDRRRLPLPERARDVDDVVVGVMHKLDRGKRVIIAEVEAADAAKLAREDARRDADLLLRERKMRPEPSTGRPCARASRSCAG